jgi:histidinol phosphatase-like enzyme (inositol monophosphatase family)
MGVYDRELEFAIAAVQAAGRLTLEYFGGPLTVERKPDASPVTIADRRAEELIRARIVEAFPEDGQLGEEFGHREGTSGRRWIIDPIDGTQSFIRGVPLYGVLLGLEAQGGCIVGAMALPPLGQTFWAAKGEGAYCNGTSVQVSGVRALEEATLLTTDVKPEAFGERYAGVERLLHRVGRQRGWGDCYGYGLVAAGQAEIMLDPILNPWDSAALLPILEEAGGVFLDWSGRASIYGGSGIATTRALLPQVADALGVPLSPELSKRS